MTLAEFMSDVKSALPIGTVIDNPGGGTSKIVSYTASNISYVRKKSTIVVAFEDLYETFKRFEGQCVSSSELKAFRPSVFDSTARPAGHSCNCTFLFCVLEKLELSGPITGAGVKSNPFAVKILGGSAV